VVGKVRENLARRMAKRQGYELVKSRRRDPRALGFGKYMLTARRGARARPVFGCDDQGNPTATLEQIEAYLTGDGDGDNP
jgi:hypothetical protein